MMVVFINSDSMLSAFTHCYHMPYFGDLANICSKSKRSISYMVPYYHEDISYEGVLCLSLYR